jgi:hypothetical protein
MSAIAGKSAGPAEKRVATPERFWQRFAQLLDRLVIRLSRQTIPAALLRRSRHDLARCRRLLLDSAVARSAARRTGARPRRAV